ncbi:hypothetical protein BDW66DRAFT_161160 [Aspergillus desertorum]
MASRTQSHHFIPRFVLRRFAPEDQPPAAPAASPPRRESRRDFLVNKIDLDAGILTQRPVSTEFALVDMYRDPGFAENPYHLEEKLSKLESQASEVLRKACLAFDGGNILELKRGEVDTLRKFLFLMKYRSTDMFDRYNHDSIDGYDSNDWLRMRTYMETKGFTKPRDVWFDNLSHMLDLEMDAAKTWVKTLSLKVYPDDALMFYLHLSSSFMAFCSPENTEDEFLLTQNAYGIFEGPSSGKIDLATGKDEGVAYTEYHNFAPVAPKLLIVLRSHVLQHSGKDNMPDNLRRHMEAAMRAQHLCPERAGSILQDLPVQPCSVLYTHKSSSSLHENDRFRFQCFKVSGAHVTTINNLLLEEAHHISSIVYHSPVALRSSLHKYLEDSRQGMKRFLDRSSDKRRSYFRTLKKVLRDLGGTASSKLHPFDLAEARIRVHMAIYAGLSVGSQLLNRQERAMFPRAYTMLKQDVTVKGFWTDVDQASRMLLLRIKIDSALRLSNLSEDEKQAVRDQRAEFFMTFPVERIWIYLKIARNLNKFREDDFMVQVKPLVLHGVEDGYAEVIARFPSARGYLACNMFMAGAT